MNYKTKINAQQIVELGQLAQDPKMTLEKMGWKYGVTKERIRQLLKLYFPDLNRQRYEKRKVVCPKCSEKMLPSKMTTFYSEPACKKCVKLLRSTIGWNYKYKNCIVCHKTEKRHHSHGVCLKCYDKWAYHNLPGRRESVLKINRRWQKEHPGLVRVYVKKAVKVYQAKIKADPIRYRAYLDKTNADYHNKMRNPEYRERMRIYYRLRRLLKKNPEMIPYRKEILNGMLEDYEKLTNK